MSRSLANAGQREHLTSFACRCSDEEVAKCDEVLEFVKAKLDPTEHNFVSRVIGSLQWDYGANITGIYCDQWFGISCDTYDDNEGGLSTWVQCDMVEDGLAWTWQHFYDKYGEERGGTQ